MNIDCLHTSLTDFNWIPLAAWHSCHNVEIAAQNERSEITQAFTVTYFYVNELFDHVILEKNKGESLSILIKFYLEIKVTKLRN